MSHFYSSIQGNRGEATCRGSKASGIEGHIRGWDLGVRVQGYVNERGEDEFRVTLTNGSGYGNLSKHIGIFTRADLTAET